MDIEIVGGRVLQADGTIADGSVTISEGRIAAGGKAPARWNAVGLLVLPGIVDLHGDAFERQLMPRPGVHFPHRLALGETDRQLVANGITTAYHGLTWSWEPGLRSPEAARAFRSALAEAKPHLAADTRLHLRFEVFCIDDVEEIERWLAEGAIDLLAFNEHLDHVLPKLNQPEKLSTYTGRTGMDAGAFLALVRSLDQRRSEVPAAIARLAVAAKAAGVPMASHDDMSPEMHREFAALGCAISEFPLDQATAEAARDLGNAIVLGAPNVLRGGSHCDRLSAAESVSLGLCTVLTSDYYYPAQLQAAFRLVADGVATLPEAWRLISANPATAVGLDDRGSIAPGKRADLVVVDDRDPASPRVVATFTAGRLAYATSDAFAMVA